MPNTNSADLSRVYVRYTDTARYDGVTEVTVKDNHSIDIVFDLEAGKAIFDIPAQYSLYVFLTDLSDQTVLWTPTPAGGAFSGTMGDAGWPSRNSEHVWTVPAGVITSALDGHVIQALGTVCVGKHDPIANSKLSELITVTQP